MGKKESSSSLHPNPHCDSLSLRPEAWYLKSSKSPTRPVSSTGKGPSTVCARHPISICTTHHNHRDIVDFVPALQPTVSSIQARQTRRAVVVTRNHNTRIQSIATRRRPIITSTSAKLLATSQTLVAEAEYALRWWGFRAVGAPVPDIWRPCDVAVVCVGGLRGYVDEGVGWRTAVDCVVDVCLAVV